MTDIEELNPITGELVIDEILRAAAARMGSRTSEAKRRAGEANLEKARAARQTKPCNCRAYPGEKHKYNCPQYRRDKANAANAQKRRAEIESRII